MALKIITLVMLQSIAKSNIVFPEQKAVDTVLFGHKGFTFLFYRDSVPVGLFISTSTNDKFHYGWKVIKKGRSLGRRFYEIHDIMSVGFDKSIMPSGLLI